MVRPVPDRERRHGRTRRHDPRELETGLVALLDNWASSSGGYAVRGPFLCTNTDCMHCACKSPTEKRQAARTESSHAKTPPGHSVAMYCGKGRLISIEGLDGAGKSTVIEALAERVNDALVLREPGGTALGEFLRAALKHLPLPELGEEYRALSANAAQLIEQLKEEAENAELRALADHLLSGADLELELVDEEITALEELLLFNAARAQLVAQVIRPALIEGRTVILDRFFDSTIAYQGFGRGLDPDYVRDCCLTATDGVVPDLTLYLRIKPETRQARLAGRGEPDRIERSGEDFFRRVVKGFDSLASSSIERIVVIDAEKAPGTVADIASSVIEARL